MRYNCDCDLWDLVERVWDVFPAGEKASSGKEYSDDKLGSATQEREIRELKSLGGPAQRECGSWAFVNGSRGIRRQIEVHDSICSCKCFGRKMEKETK